MPVRCWVQLGGEDTAPKSGTRFRLGLGGRGSCRDPSPPPPPQGPHGQPLHPPGCQTGINGSPPLKDLKRLQASATYLTLSSCQDSVGCQGPRAGWGGHYCPSPYLLVTGHTTQEPSQTHTVLRTWCGGRQAQASQRPPQTPQSRKERS